MSKNAKIKFDYDNSIAIIGMACRLPGADNLQEFWSNLINGVESVRKSTEKELKSAGLPQVIIDDPNFISSCGRLDNIEYFDAGFFDITATLAEITSPQQRLLLEMAQLALDDAAYYAETYEGKIGIFSAIESSDYEYEHLSKHPDLYERLGYKTVQFANDIPFSATQIAYKLNLTGPAVNISTACSSSLVAIHLAGKCLLNYEADMMLAGGASYSVNQEKGYLYQDGGIGSADGHCRAFDINAKGTVSGNGAAMIVLKRLQDAIDDGDNIYSVILSSAINNDGKQKVSYSAPGLEGQADVIADALSMADISADKVSYVEAHGTGTSLGDPIEVAALTEAFRETTQKFNYCGIGALKSNIGHLACAAGVAGLVKTVLSLYHKKIPPTLNVDQVNPKLNIETSPFYINTEPRDWNTEDDERVAGVSSFGMGGTNAHAVLAEWKTEEIFYKPERSVHIFPISAKSKKALKQNANAICDYINQHPDLNIQDIAYTLQAGRRAYDYRTAVSTGNLEALKQQLSIIQNDITCTSKAAKNIVFMFPGQGNQFLGMAKSLYDQEKYFKGQFDQCNTYIQHRYSIDLKKVIFACERPQSLLLNKTEYTQIALFVTEYALAKTLIHYGVIPTLLLGHSLGEYVAATIANVFNIESALDLIVLRGRIIQNLPTGLMASIHLTESETGKRLPEGIDIAAINRENQTVVSGPDSLLEPFLRELEQDNITVHRLNTSHAFHSSMMDPCLNEYYQYISTIQINPPEIQFISNITGKRITPEKACSPQYWLDHLRKPVRFFDGLVNSKINDDILFIEVGPGHSISSIFNEHKVFSKALVFNGMSSINNPKTDMQFFHQCIAGCWENGVDINWSHYQQDYQRRRMHLPGYQFDRQRYWVDKLLGDSTERQKNHMSKVSILDEIQNWLYAPVWSQAPIIRNSECLKSIQSKHVWLVIGNEVLAESLCNMLRAHQRVVIRITNGNKLSKLDENHYCIDFSNFSEYRKLIDLLAKEKILIKYIIDCKTYETAESFDIEIKRNYIETPFYSLLYLLRSLAGLSSETLNFISLGKNGISITGDEKIHPVFSMIDVLCRTFDQEYQNMRCCYIDLTGEEQKDNKSIYKLCESILNEFFHKLPNKQLGYRGQRRYIADYRQLDLSSISKQHLTKLKKNGIYLITGGFGGIGYEIAKYLSKNYQAKLILIGRHAPLYSCLDSKKQFEPDDLSNKDLNKILELKKLGATVISRAVDVSDYQKLSLALNFSAKEFGAINGIVHAAGVAGGGMLELKTEDDLSKTFSPKVYGSLNLIKYFSRQNDTLDFCLMFSSQNALKAGPLRGDYSAANAFMDGLALSSSQQVKFPIMSLNWCAWKDVGMLFNSVHEQNITLSEQKIQECISTQQGTELFELVTKLDFPRLVVSKSQEHLKLFEKQRENATEVDLEPRQAAQTQSRPIDLSAQFKPAETELSQELEKIWSETIGIKPIGIDDNFFELGGNSLLSIQIVLQIQQRFEVDLTLRQFLERPTIEQLENEILRIKTNSRDFKSLEKLLENLENLYEEETN